VRPGDRIPVDGVVTTGTSFIDESTITGEPTPAAKQPGDRVFAGAVNQRGSFRLRAEQVGSATVLARIVALVQQAQASKAPVQRLVDRIAGVFVPVVIGLAMLTFVAWLAFGGAATLTHALVTSITVLVIACPCALGLATPTAIMVGIGKGAEHHLLIKDAESLELGRRVDAVALDKTGTITEGRPVVTDLAWAPATAGSGYASILYALEASSEHPLAEAVVARLRENEVQPVELEEFESLTGRGVRGSYRGQRYFVGNEPLLQEHGIALDPALQTEADEWREQAKTVVFFADGNRVLAALAIADQVKPTSLAAVQTLLGQGIDVYLLTGDNEQTARAVARQVGLTHYRAGLLPAEKAAFVEQLQAAGKVVAMVGDGINDAHALAQADVSIAMGKGSDIAMDVAKMTLVTSDLQAVPRALRLSRQTVRGIRQNLFWAFLYNLIGIPIAAGVLYPINGFLLDPMIAGAAMALSSVSVVGNSLRLKRLKL
jgi:Cu2+-exporting ATPase